MNAVNIVIKRVRNILSIPPISESEASRIIFFVFANSVSLSIWYTNVWAPFIFTCFGESNFLVGLMTAINGVSQMLTAIVSGYVADKVWGPSRTLQVAQMIGVISLIAVFIGIWSMNIYIIGFTQCLEGIYMGFNFTSVESVFAQCLRTGERDWLYSVKFSLEASGPIAGICLTIILFACIGNTWDLKTLQWVMASGLCLNVISQLTFLCTFKPLPYNFGKRTAQAGVDIALNDNGVDKEDAKTLERGQGGDHQGRGEGTLARRECCGEEDARVVVDPYEVPIEITSNQPSFHACLSSSEGGDIHQSLVGSRAALDSAPFGFDGVVGVGSRNGSFYPVSFPSICQRDETEKDDSPPNLTQRLWTQDKSSEILPPDFKDNEKEGKDKFQSSPARRLCYVDIEAEKATGWRKKIMLWIPLKYYPYILVAFDVISIFGSGMTVQYFTLFMMKIYDVSPLEMATINLFNAIIVMGLGIVNGVVAQRYGRVRTILPPKLIGAMILLWMALARGTKYAPKVLMCIAYVVRGALMNCSAGLSRALVMDIIPEHRRGRWNAIESIQNMGWSGTAFLGGFLADSWGYGGAFIVTFCFHITSCMLLLPLTVRNDTRLPVLVDAEDAMRNEGAVRKANRNATMTGDKPWDGDFNCEKRFSAQGRVLNRANDIASNG